MEINTTFWHRAKVYFTCIMSLSWLIAVQTMNKINLFFSEISQQTNTIYAFIKKLPLFLKFGTEPDIIVHGSVTHGT